MQRKRPRPMKPEPHEARIHVRVTESQFRILEEAAATTGFELAAFCRTMLIAAVQEGLQRRLRGIVLTRAERAENEIPPGQTGT